jgi:thiamine biosynthesis protein ThiS
LDTQTTISVTVNGEQRRVNGVDPAKVAVERNLAIVPKSTLEDVPAVDGDRFEIVHFVGGG